MGRFTRTAGRRYAWLCLTALLSMGRATAVAAQADALEPLPHRFAVGGELGYFNDSQFASSVHVMTMRLFGEYAFDERWSLAGQYGVIGIDSVPDRGSSETTACSGNPTLLGLRRGRAGAFDYVLGFGGAAPLAAIDRSGAGRLEHTAYNWAQAMTGWWDVWLWAPSRGAVLTVARLGLSPYPRLRLQAAVEPALMLPAREDFVYGDPVALFVPVALSAATQLGPVTPGFRVQAVVTTLGADALQVSLQPWARLQLGAGFLEVRYTVSVGEPLAGERGPGSWGLHVGSGGSL